PQMQAYKRQQARWAKGSTQVLLKLAWPLMTSTLSLRQRIMGLLQLFQYAIQPILLLTLALAPVMMITHSFVDLSIAPLGVIGFGAPLLCILGQHALYRDWPRRSLYFPLLVIFSSGMAVNNSRAAISALFRRPAEFIRTPKFHLDGKTNHWLRSQYHATGSPDVIWEIGFGLYTVLAAWLAHEIAPSFIPYFLLYAAAFFSVAVWGLMDRWTVMRPVRSKHTAEVEPIGQPGR